MRYRVLRALATAALLSGSVVVTAAAPAQAAGATFSVQYEAFVPAGTGQVVGCRTKVLATKNGVLIAEAHSSALTANTPPNKTQAWDRVQGGPAVQIQISAAETGEILTYTSTDRVGEQYGAFARDIYYPIYRWRLVAENQVSGWVVPGTALGPYSQYCRS